MQEARILNHATWNPLAQLGHPGTIISPETAVVYREIADVVGGSAQLHAQKSHFIVCQLPVKVTQQKVPLNKPNVKLGVGKTQPLGLLQDKSWCGCCPSIIQKETLGGSYCHTCMVTVCAFKSLLACRHALLES